MLIRNQTLNIVSPNFESLKNSKEFHVISVIIQFYYGEGTGVKDNQINFIIFIYN